MNGNNSCNYRERVIVYNILYIRGNTGWAYMSRINYVYALLCITIRCVILFFDFMLTIVNVSRIHTTGKVWFTICIVVTLITYGLYIPHHHMCIRTRVHHLVYGILAKWDTSHVGSTRIILPRGTNKGRIRVYIS